MQGTAEMQGDNSVRRGVIDGFSKRPHTGSGVNVEGSSVSYRMNAHLWRILDIPKAASQISFYRVNITTS